MIRTAQRGFTLIELVVVIVILGILAAFAVPRFMGLEDQARVAAANAMAGSIRSAATMAHGVWEASGNPATITVPGVATPITMVGGYPNNAGIQSLIQDTSGFTVSPAGNTFTPNGAKNALCRIIYNQAPGNASAPFTISYANLPATATSAADQSALQTNC